MKKILIITTVIAMAVMLAFPAILFAEEGDANSTIGVRDTDGDGVQTYSGFYADQYILGDKDSSTPQPNDTIGDNNSAQIDNGDADDDGDGERDGAGAIGDGDTEVFCIDGDTSWNSGADQYTLTDIDVSDELVGENTGNSIIEPFEAEAVEIMATEATGATSAEDQVAVWQETDDISGTFSGNQANADTINTAVEALAADFINNGDGKTLDEFLDDENINEIEVTVEQNSNIFLEDIDPEHESGTATAIMENPLVPIITDEGKNVYWYILGGAFNISFSPTELVTEASSLDHSDGSDADQMTDEIDAIDGNDVDNDGQEGADDHYGIATISYYYFNWELDEHPEGTMGVNLYAWVDVDKDGLFDIVDIDPEKAADGLDPDGDAVGDFQDNFQVVQVDSSGSVETDTTTGDVVTAPLPQTAMDIHKVEGGKVVIANVDLSDAEEEDPLLIRPRSESERSVTKQRFSTLAYTEPFDDDPIYFGTVIFKINEKEEALAGAVFEVVDENGVVVDTMTSDENGYVSTSGLEWTGEGTTYYIREISAPSGYDVNPTVYEVLLSGTGVLVTTGEGGNLPFTVSNKKTPPPEDPEDPKDPKDPGGEITVLGLTELPFTGMPLAMPITGAATLLGGIGMLLWSFINRRKNWKHSWKKK